MTISLDQLPYNPETVYDQPLIEVTQSSLQTFLACPQKFAFRYLLLLRPKGVSIPLLVGTAVHAGLEVLLNPEDKRPGSERVDDALKAVEHPFKYYEEHPELTVGKEDKIEHGRAQAHACVEAWWVINGDDLKDWKIIKTEMNVRAQPSATITSPLQDRMAGKLDGLLQDTHSTNWLLEHKTRSRMDNLDVLGLELDHQALWYICMSVIKSKRDGSIPVPDGFLYDAIQKPMHRMTHRGWEDLKNRMFEAMIADPQKYFHLAPIKVEADTLTRAFDNFKRIVEQMDGLTAENVYMNLTSCDDYGGCPYRRLCYNRANAANPKAVLTMPGIDMYEIAQPHEELKDGN